jgi:signal transduction histidine kinase
VAPALPESLAVVQPPAWQRLGLGPRLTGAFLLMALLTFAAAGFGLLALRRQAAAEVHLAQTQAQLQALSVAPPAGGLAPEQIAPLAADLQAASAGLAASRRQVLAGLAGSAALAAVLGLGLGWYSTRRLTLPLAALGAAAERISANDLATPVAAPGAPGELGRLAVALEHMRRMLRHEREQVRRLAILEERDRIGREMHDGLAQVLGFVNTKAQTVREYLRAAQPAPAAQHLEELIVAAREAYADAREAIAGLRVEGAVERPLAELLAEQLERFRRQSGAAADLRVAPEWADGLLAPTARVQLLRIVQEALTNARKHAAARTVTVSLGLENGQASLCVADDGRGFHLSRLLSPDFSRFGLRTMRERAQAVGGVFRIESLPGQGTRIHVHLPLRGAAEAEAP